jgi:hypothetical protein
MKFAVQLMSVYRKNKNLHDFCSQIVTLTQAPKVLNLVGKVPGFSGIVSKVGQLNNVASKSSLAIQNFLNNGQLNLEEIQKFLLNLNLPEKKALIDATRIYLDQVLPAFSLFYFVVEAVQVYILLCSLVNITYFKFSNTHQKIYNNGVVFSLTLVNNRIVGVFPLIPFRKSYKVSIKLWGFVMLLGLIVLGFMVGLEGTSLYLFARMKGLDHEELFLSLSAEVLRRESKAEDFKALAGALKGSKTFGLRVATSVAAVFSKSN